MLHITWQRLLHGDRPNRRRDTESGNKPATEGSQALGCSEPSSSRASLCAPVAAPVSQQRSAAAPTNELGDSTMSSTSKRIAESQSTTPSGDGAPVGQPTIWQIVFSAL